MIGALATILTGFISNYDKIFPPKLPDGSFYAPSNDIKRELNITFAASGAEEQLEASQRAMIQAFEGILPKEVLEVAVDIDAQTFKKVFIDVYSKNLTLQEVIEINKILLSSDYQEYEDVEKKIAKIMSELIAEYFKAQKNSWTP